jgi:hypothetical protein
MFGQMFDFRQKITPLSCDRGVNASILLVELTSLLTLSTFYLALNKHLVTRRNLAKCNPYATDIPPNLPALKSALNLGVLRK